ncbi:MAG TPA: MauE/DoxX family redox-associated membrane protein [Bacteroidia bacterium]|jgi:hypothetical protein|nr:MauE/DoxX family redox-associated membrane protein [Bacteroidia bacterium]
MVKKILFIILCILLGGVYIFSAYAKLHPIEPFEYTFVDMGVSGWRMAPFIARFFIGLEFFLGALFIFNFKIRTTAKISIAVLLFFSLYLVGLIFLTGNKGNCGCFGTYLVMTPLQALIKNAVMLVLTWGLYKYYNGFSFKKDFILFYALLLAAMVTPHILNYVDLDYSAAYLSKKEDQYKIELDTLYKYAKVNTPPKSLSTGRHIIAFMSLTCPHCRIAAKKMKIIKEKNPDIPIYFVLNGDEKDFKPFFEDTKATNIPYCNLNGKGFIFLGGTILPYICLVNNSTVETSVDYMHLDQEQIESWLKK